MPSYDKISNYKDRRGLPIAQSSIDEWLKDLGTTEEKIIALIGEDCAKIDGYFTNFLDHWYSMHKWLTDQTPRDNPLELDGFETVL